MFYKKQLLTKKSKTYKIAYTSFAAGMQGEIDENLLPHKYAKMTYNFKIKDGKLSSGHGFKGMKLPKMDCISERAITTQGHNHLMNLSHFRNYDATNKKDIDRVLFFNNQNKRLYWSQIEGLDPLTYPLFSEVFLEKPTAICYRINGEDSLLISSPQDALRVFKTGQTAQTLANGPKIISMCEHYERIFAILEGERVSLAFSANLDPTNWDFTIDDGGFIDFVDERGKLEKVLSFNDYVYVFREHGISRVTAYGSQNDFSVNHLYTSCNKIYGNSASVCGDRIFFLANDGVYVFDGISARKIELGFEKLLYDRNVECCSAYHKGKYYLACRMTFEDNLKIGCENNGYNNNVLIEIDAKTYEVNLTRGVDINSLLGLKYHTVDKLLATFHSRCHDKIGELTDDGKLFDTNLEKIWTSPKSNLGFANQMKVVKEIRLLSKYDCEIEISTDQATKTYSVKGKPITQRIRTNIKGELVQVSFKVSGQFADISMPELIIGVI